MSGLITSVYCVIYTEMGLRKLLDIVGLVTLDEYGVNFFQGIILPLYFFLSLLLQKPLNLLYYTRKNSRAW